MSTLESLRGQVAFVTGAGSGIGRGVAERLARDGADVCVTDVDLPGAEETAGLVRAAGRKAHVVRVNVASQQQVQEGVESCVEALGRLDIAVANAGIGRAGTLLELSLEDWQTQLDVNLTGVFLTAQAAARKQVEAGRGGRIVCMASLAAVQSGQMIWGYSATKAAVTMLVRGWAQELGPHGITVNAIGPGVIETPLASMLTGKEGSRIRKSLEELTPVGRAGQPSDIAGLVAFMCSPDGAFMTGSYVLMDGGLRDAPRPGMPGPDDPRLAEFVELFGEEVARGQRIQKLIDER